MNVRCHEIDINKIRSSFLSFKVIKLPKLNTTDVTILIATDFPKFHTHKDFRYTSDEDLCAVKTDLVLVLVEGKISSVHFQSNRTSTAVKTLDLERFWSGDSYGTVKKLDRILMTEDEKQTYEILGKKYFFKERHFEVVMLRKDPKIHLNNNKLLAVQRLESLEQRSKNSDEKF